MTMTIGRIGTDNDVTLESPVSWAHSAIDVIPGRCLATTLADASHLRDEIIAMGHYATKKRLIVPILWPSSPTLNGFYHVQAANARTIKVTDRGLIDFEIAAALVGRFGDVQVRSHLDGTVLENDYTVLEADASFWHSPAANVLAYNGGPSGSTASSRTGALTDDVTNVGSIPVYRDQSPPGFDTEWLIDPASFYVGACRITVDTYLRAGLLAPNTETAWQMDNGLIRVTPGINTVPDPDESNGEIIITAHDGTSAWGTAHPFAIYRNAVQIPRWHTFTILRNDPEAASIRLIRDADTDPAGSDRHTLDLTLWRGAPFVSCIYRYSAGALAYTVGHANNETATTTGMTPTGASGPIGIRRNADDTDGNRWFLASPSTTTADTANGELDWSATTLLKFAVGIELGGASAAAGDAADDVCSQYMGNRNPSDQIVAA